MHPDWRYIIEHAQHKGISTGLVTNGVLLRDSPAVRNLAWLRISLDAATGGTYERTRESRQWPKAMKALELAGSLKGPYVGVGFVVTRENYRELAAACALVKSFGIPYVRISAMFSYGGALYYAGVEDTINEQRESAKNLQDDTFKVVDFFDDRVNDLKAARPDYDFCGEQQFVLYIGGNQKVYTCCTNAYTPHGEIGDLREQSFKSWMGKHRRYDFNARGCHHCQFSQKNRVINFMLDKNPTHVDFV